MTGPGDAPPSLDVDDEGRDFVGLEIEGGAAGVVDMPAVGMERHRDKVVVVPDHVDAVGLSTDHLAGVGRKGAPFLQLRIIGPGAVVEPVVLGVALGAVNPPVTTAQVP